MTLLTFNPHTAQQDIMKNRDIILTQEEDQGRKRKTYAVLHDERLEVYSLYSHDFCFYFLICDETYRITKQCKMQTQCNFICPIENH